MTAVVALFLGVLVAAGVWLGVQAAMGNVVIGGAPAAAERTRPRSRRFEGLHVGRVGGPFVIIGAITLAVVLLVLTRLVVVAGAAGLAVVLIPGVLQARARRTRAVAKMRAAAEFVESIRGALGAGAGLEAAIIDAAHRPPAALADELGAFVEYAKTPDVGIEQALRFLAEEAGEPSIDLLVGSLLAALRGAAGDMGQLFERIAEQGRSFAETRALTQADRAKVEFQTRILSLLVIAVALLSVVVSPDLTSAYDASPVGQLRLLIPVLVFGFGWWWLTRLNRVEAQYRFRLREGLGT